MCGLCGVFSTGHWAEDGGRRARVLRARIVGHALAHHGLDLAVWGGHSYVVRDRKGRSAVVTDLTSLWAEAERLAGRPLDPLDAGLVASLGTRA